MNVPKYPKYPMIHSTLSVHRRVYDVDGLFDRKGRLEQ